MAHYPNTHAENAETRCQGSADDAWLTSKALMRPTPASVIASLACVIGGVSPSRRNPRTRRAPPLPISIERVRDALGRKPLVTIEEILASPTFRVLIEEQPFRWEPLFTPADVSVGVLPPGPAHHYEFLRMFSPELTRPYTAFNQNELLLMTIETLATTLAVRAGSKGIRSAWKGVENRRLEQLRREIAADIAAIEARRQQSER